MNTQSHRVIYNPARACRMAVAETARAEGKSSTTGSTRTTRRKRVFPGSCKQNKPIALVDTESIAINSVVITTTTATTSVLSANEGTLNITSGGKFTSQGAELLAQEDVNVTAKSVDLQAVTDASSSANQFETSSFTVGSALSDTVGSKITAISDSLQIADNTSNERLKGAATLKAGYDAYKLGSGGVAEALAKQGTTKDGDPGGSAFGISFSVGSSSSKQDSASATTQNRGTSIQAANINITATQGDITATAAKLQAENVSLDAKKDINLLAAVNSTDIQSSNESHNLGAGVSVGVGQQSGISFQLSAGQANGNTNGTETTFDNTQVTATNTLTTKSGNNTNLVGAQLGGNSVKMDVGGDLNVITLQDKSNFASEQHSSGINLSLCLPPICYGSMVTVTATKSDSAIDHNYQSATGQSGIAAGSGGYDITVKGNTDLVGAAITSKAPTEQNSLKTGSLTSSDLANNQNTSSASSSITVGNNVGAMVIGNVMGALNNGAGMPANGSQSTTTQSVIGNGSITITGTGDASKDANSATQVATLTNRDPSKANGSLTNTLTLQQAQAIPGKQQTAAENAQIATMVGSVAFNVVGDIATANGWAESSPQKIALHTIAGFVTVAASGGNGATGAVAAGANELVTSTVKDIVDAALPMPANATPEQARQVMADRKSLMEAAATVVGVTAVAVTGGNGQAQGTGGTVALLADQFNRQLHPDERARARQLAAASGGKYTVAQIENAMRSSGNSAFGEDIMTHMVVNTNDKNGVYDSGAVFNAGGDGQSIVQVLPNGGNVDPALAAFITAGTGGNASPYSWTAPTSSGPAPITSGATPLRHASITADGKSFSLPVADCPAASCTNGSPIAWSSSDPKDQAALADYKAALDRQNGKVAVTAGVAVVATVALPVTVAGLATGGGVVGGTSYVAGQLIDDKPVDPTQAVKETGKGAATAVAVYGVTKIPGVVDAAMTGPLAKVETGGGATGVSSSTKPSAGGKPDAMLPDAELGSNLPGGLNETTPIKDQFGKAPNTSTLTEHLSTGGPSVPKSGVSGAHSDTAYQTELVSINGVEVAPPKTLAPGITEYTYNTPERIAKGQAPLIKTTYDSTYTDAQILDMSKRASSQVWTEIQKTGVIPLNNTTTVIVDGVPFRVLIGFDKNKSITSIYSHPGK